MHRFLGLGAAASFALVAPASADVVIGNYGAAIGTGTAFGTSTTTMYKAAGWTMGNEAYDLDNISLSLNFANAGTGIFSLWSGAGTPQTRLVELVGPPQVGAGQFEFVPDAPVTMQPGETYWVYVESIPNPTGGFTWDGTSPSTIPTGIATSAGFIFNGASSSFRNRFQVNGTLSGGPGCYANCDESTAPPVLNVADFGCFLQRFAAGDPYANCDNSTQAPILNVADFGCFLQSFAAGCR